MRDHCEIATDQQACYGLVLMYEGREQVTVGGHSAEVGPGDILHWDSTIPISFRLYSPVHKITVFVPQDRMHEALPQSRRLVGKTIDWRRGMGAVTACHISALGAQASALSQEQMQPAADIALELIATSLGCQQSEAGSTSKEALLAKVKRYIEGNLDDTGLGPQSIATRFGLSLRYVHLLFVHEGTTVSQWILARRLERCRHELATAGPHKNITEVAYRWGFRDTAHFSRVFRQHFGVTPRAYRKKG